MVGGTREVAFQPRFRGWCISHHVFLVAYPWGLIRQPLKRGWDTLSPSRSYHAMVGYAYINPLTGLPPSHGTLSPHVMGGYAYINPLTGLPPSHGTLSYHAMVGYAYINPLAIPPCYGGLFLHQPLNGVDLLSRDAILPCYGRLCLHQPLSYPPMLWGVMPTSTP